jgi:hypothetical protein
VPAETAVRFVLLQAPTFRGFFMLLFYIHFLVNVRCGLE